MSIADVLQKQRKKLNYSQRQVADLLEVSQSTYCDWESGAVKPKTDNLLKISKLYDIELSELLESLPNFNIVNSPNTFANSLNNSPNSKVETSEALIKVAESLDKLVVLVEKFLVKEK